MLIPFREAVRESLFSCLLASCRATEPESRYSRHDHEEPLRALLSSGDDRLAPPPHRTFHTFLLAELRLAWLMLAPHLPRAAPRARCAGAS
ncbi:hypothetical protein [Planotetraspora sp. GP83]|uniref:hypothetical protein n=1 Tax=Planotetraspora sp. GP83 TaxID=3156264 RepID=UPI003514FE2F